MTDALQQHIRTHLRCLRRNRLIFALGLLVVLGTAMALVSVLVFDNESSRFQMLKRLAWTLHGAIGTVTPFLGLFLLWEHRRTRSLTLVATTAAPLGAWVLSLFLTALIVGVAAHAVVAALMATLSVVWGVPYQFGFVYLALEHIVRSMIGLGVVTALGARCHPVITVVLVLVVNDGLVQLLRQAVAGADAGPLLAGVRALLTGVYYLLPASSPFAEHTSGVWRSMRVAESDWRYLAGSFAYALLVLAFAQTVTLVLLRRRPRQ